MQISALSASSLSSINPLKQNQAAVQAKSPAATAESKADTFTATTSWTPTESAAAYKKPVQSVEPLATAPQTEQAKKLSEPSVTIDVPAEEAVTQQAQAAETPEPPSFGAEEFKQFLTQFGRQNGDEGFDAKMDLNGDGRVDGSDLSVVLANYRRTKS